MKVLRVIGGSARGLRLESVPGESTRPITDRVKEALFNIIGQDIVAASFLDLFAGTGAVAIEALSRGAAFARLIDTHPLAVRTIRANLKKTRLADRAEVVQRDAFAVLGGAADRRFDYVYIAPPQYKGLWKKALLTLDARPDWLQSDAWVIVQIHPVEAEPVELKYLEAFDRRQYGSTMLMFYIPREQPGGTEDDRRPDPRP